MSSHNERRKILHFFYRKQQQQDFSRWFTIANTCFWSNQGICKIWSGYVQWLRRRCINKKVPTRNVDQYPLHHMTYAPAKFEASMSSGIGGNALTRNIWFDLDTRSRSHEALPSTSCDLCTCKLWSCYDQWLRRCITKKIHWLTLTPRSRGSRSHKVLPSTLHIMCRMDQQSLMLLHPMVKETMHLQGNTKCCPVPSTSCDLCTYRV